MCDGLLTHEHACASTPGTHASWQLHAAAPASALLGGGLTTWCLTCGLAKKPMLGHITTFGGHPVCVAAALATLQTLTDENIYQDVLRKEELIRSKLKHPIIKEVRSSGLMMSVELTRRKYLKHVVNHTIKNGAVIDYFLFNNKSFRLAPPLIINDEQIEEGCEILLAAMDYARFKYTKR